jgi:hypothetical protein
MSCWLLPDKMIVSQHPWAATCAAAGAASNATLNTAPAMRDEKIEARPLELVVVRLGNRSPAVSNPSCQPCDPRRTPCLF